MKFQEPVAPHPIDVGSVADWLAAIGTVGTLIVALFVFGLEVRDTRRRHASRVIAWIDLEASAVRVRNGGDEPVTRVMVALFTAGRYHDPTSAPSEPPSVESWEWLAPGDERSFSPPDVDWTADLFPPRVRLEFTDMTRRRWLRDETGMLTRRWVIPLRQDWSKISYWRQTERAARKARARFTRWQWPDI